MVSKDSTSTYPPAAEHSLDTDQASDSDIALKVESFTSPAAQALVAQANAFNASLYGHADQSPIDPDEFDAEQGGRFLVAYLYGEPVACGGLRAAQPPAPEHAGEVKRMYVSECVRRRGVARRILTALEDAAREYGYEQVVLDTGRKQGPAHRLYEAAGYHQIPGYTIYRDSPGNRAYAKRLA